MIVLADVGGFSDGERAALTAWVEAGGVLVRFAGPRRAQSGAGQTQADPLLPVRLPRVDGARGAMSWGAPRQLQPFPETSPFAGLDVPSDVDIRAQVMAQPDPDLPQRVMASLEDGTPLVTGRALGEGRIVLFHVTADPDWSNLPLSGLFVQMLERLAQGAGGLGPAPDLVDDTIWTPVQVLDGFGNLQTPTLIAGVAGPGLPKACPLATCRQAFTPAATGEPLSMSCAPRIALRPFRPCRMALCAVRWSRRRNARSGRGCWRSASFCWRST